MLKGKNAVVTGSTSGIGLGIAREFAKDGANVLINGFGPAADIEKERAGIEKDFGVKAIYSPADMTKPAEIAAMIKTAETTLGSCDILVNNAGIQHVAPVEEFPVDKWDAIIAINLSSAFHTIRLAIPGMRARNWGRIINIASIHSYIGSVHRIDYGTTKTALLGMTRSVAMETATTGITCNAICPGTVLTEAIDERIVAMMKEKNLSRQDAEKQFLAPMQPAGRFVKASSVAALAVFLCSVPGGDMTGAELSM